MTKKEHGMPPWQGGSRGRAPRCVAAIPPAGPAIGLRQSHVVCGLASQSCGFATGPPLGLTARVGSEICRGCFRSPIGMCYGSRCANRMGGSAARCGVSRREHVRGRITVPRGDASGLFRVNTHNLIGGLIVAVLALLMLGYAFYVPNTVIPRLMWLLWPRSGLPRRLVWCPCMVRGIFMAASLS